MKKFSTVTVTNLLLSIIAVLLLIQVVSTCKRQYKFKKYHRAEVSDMGAAPEFSSDQPHGHSHDMGEPEASPHGSFDFQSMVGAALKCPSDPTLTLSDTGCKGAEAKKRIAFISDLSKQNLPPRVMFDKIIEKYGEKALTDEALEIRRNNRSK